MLEDLDERVAIMSEPADLNSLDVDPYQEGWR